MILHTNKSQLLRKRLKNVSMFISEKQSSGYRTTKKKYFYLLTPQDISLEPELKKETKKDQKGKELWVFDDFSRLYKELV